MQDTQDSGQAAVESNTDRYEGIEDNKPTFESTEPQPDALPEQVESETPEKPRKQSGYLKKLTRAETERDAERQRAATLEAELEKFKNPPKEEVKEQGKPKLEDFDTYHEYLEAKDDYLLKQVESRAETKVKDTFKENETKAVEARVAEQKRELVDSYLERVETIQSEHPDFLPAVNALYKAGVIEENGALEEAILDSPVGEKVMLHLLQNVDELEALTQMNPKQMLRTIGKIEARVEGQGESVLRQTKAAAPITPIKSGSSGSTKPVDKMSMEEYNAYRNQQEKRK